MKYFCTIETPLGTMTAAGEDGALRGLWFVGQKHYPTAPLGLERPDEPVFAALRGWLGAYFAGGAPAPAPPLGPRGSPFQELVWELLLRIKQGETTTYGSLAGQAAAAQGRPVGSARAVGNALAHNPISILIPCHRVLGASGKLSGYAGGLERKAALLRLEGWNVQSGGE